MTWAQAIGGLMILLGTGGALIIIAELLCGMVDLPRQSPELEEFEEHEAGSEYMQNRERQLRAMAKHRAATGDSVENASIVKRCEVRR